MLYFFLFIEWNIFRVCPTATAGCLKILFAALVVFHAPALGVKTTFISYGPHGAPVICFGFARRHLNLLNQDEF